MLKKLMLSTAVAVAFAGQTLFGADFNKMIPAETDFIFKVNVSRIIAIPEVQKQINEMFQKEPEQKKFYEELRAKSGFDPLKDLKNIIMFSSGKVDGAQEPLAGALVEGNFDIEKIVEVIKNDEKAKEDVNVTKVDGFNCIVPKQSKEGYGIFLDNQYVVVGSQAGVDTVKSIKMKKGKSIEANQAISKIVNKIDAEAIFSGAGVLPQNLKDMIAKNPQASFLTSVDSFFFDLNNNGNLLFNLIAQIDKKENVANVALQINTWANMVRMLAGSQSQELQEALNIVVTPDEKESCVKINLDIPAEKLEKIKASINEKVNEFQPQNGGGINAPRKLDREPKKDDAINAPRQ